MGEHAIESGDDHQGSQRGEGSGDAKAEAVGEVALVHRLLQGLEVVERVIGRLLMKDRAGDGCDGDIAARLDQDVDDGLQQRGIEERCGGDLLVGDVQHRPCRLADGHILLIPEYADDGVELDHASVFAAEIDLAAERIAILEGLPGERFVDDDDIGRGGGIALADHAAAQQRRAQQASVVRAGRGHVRLVVVRFVLRLAMDAEAGPQADAGERRCCDERGILDAWRIAQAIEHRSVGAHGD